MNIHRLRIRMPKWQAIRSASWAKELLMTFAGATLSIILTFGTAHILDEKQQREDGRQTAMMVIHDMENSADIFSQYVKQEEEYFNISQCVRENKRNLDAVGADSLLQFVTYVTASAGQNYVFDDSSERTFLSSQEAWKNIDNAAFIDAVQDFYHNRRVIYSVLNKDYLYTKPVANEEYYQILLESPDWQELDTAFWVDCARRYVERKDVDVYVGYSFVRRRYFNEYADSFRSMANRCKFMMGISDDELAQYVQNKSRTGKPLTEKKLIGTWKMQTAEDLEAEREYRSDHTYTTSFVQYMSYSYYTGQIVLRCTLNGKWELRGDSLFTVQCEDYTYSFDRSQIHYQPEQEELIDRLLETWQQSVVVSLDQMTKGEHRKSVFASIDASGNKMEFRDAEGAAYLIRFDKP